MGSFDTSLSALRAYSTAISAVGNNLANVGTTGFKGSEVTFEDVMGSLANGDRQIGAGVLPPGTSRSFSQGSITSTNNPLNAAIQGSGFFVLSPPSASSSATAGATVTYEYTRDGHFQVGADGTLQNLNGSVVMGWSMNPTTGSVNTSAAIGAISAPIGSTQPPTPTSTINISANLNAGAAADQSLTVPLTVYDSLGGSHQLSLTMTKDAKTANTWDLSLSSTDSSIQDNTKLDSLLSSTTLNFDTDGTLAQDTKSIDIKAIKFTKESGVPDTGTITLNPWATAPTGATPTGGISGLTQYNQASAVTKVTQDGKAPGTISGVSIGKGGVVMAAYTNGTSAQIGQLALSGVQNPNSLVDIGNNEFRAGADTVVLPPAVPQTGSMGQILGGSLESSNVDIATEFTNLIAFQNDYQASSRVITTQNQMYQQLFTLIP